MEYPKNYEEAKIIIKGIPNGEYYKSINKTNKKRALLVTGLSFGVSVALGLITGKPSLTYLSLPLAGAASYLSFLPLLVHKMAANKTISGEYFEGKSEEEIMQIAKDYVDGYNDFKNRGR